MHQVNAGNIKFGEHQPLVLIAGPCVIESESFCLEAAGKLKKIASSLGVPFIFKSSFDKANRLSAGSYRGPGLAQGLAILKKVKAKFKIPVLSDVHCVADVAPAAQVLDIIQIPALLCRQADII